MPERKTNYFARFVAVFAVLGAFVLVIATIATSGGDGDGDGGDDETSLTGSGPTKKGERALEEGVWVVREGDTLVSISEETGIDLDELVELNSDIDPQQLSTGQRISLRSASETDPSSEDSTTSGDDPADEFGDGSVGGDDNSSSADGVSSP
jgi:hypothetical protein